MRIAIVTCQTLPEPDHDQELLLDALRRAGADAAMLAWDAPAGNDPASFDVCVLRSCWNYHRHVDAFSRWLDHAASVTHLCNPARILRWNMHKHYLRELESAGIPIVPTAWVSRGEDANIESMLDARGWDDVVIKPCISASSFRTRRYARDEAAEASAFLSELAGDGDVMVQPYMRGVETRGERSLIWIDGQWTHAVRKTPRFSGADENVSGALPIDDAEHELGRRVLDGRCDGLLYARLDVMPEDTDDDTGAPIVSELELLEPSLFLAQNPEALRRLVSGITRTAAAVRGVSHCAE